MHIPIARAVSRVLITTLVLTLTSANVASARVFHCASGDVFCLIGSIRSANERRGPDTIILEAGTYTLTVIDNTEDGRNREGFQEGNTLPSVTSRLTIEGAGPTETTIDSSFAGRVFHIATTGNLTLRGVTIQNGFAFTGGGIFNRGRLTIEHSVIRENISVLGVGGGIVNEGGTLSIVDSRIAGNGADLGSVGGISSGGSLRILRSTIENNRGDFCGGIGAGGTITIENSAITGNHVLDGLAGGLCLGAGTITIVNTTVTKNFGGSGGGGGMELFDGAFARLINVTIADNENAIGGSFDGGGGIHVLGTGTAQLQNTILARNSVVGGIGPQLGPDCLGSITSLGNNIIGDTTDCTIDLASTDLVGDAGLGVFEDDGTPGNGHIPLLPDSPAIDAANRAACPRRDQLGQRRVDGDGDHRKFCDIGAVEFIP